jgi:hypothetical protein
MTAAVEAVAATGTMTTVASMAAVAATGASEVHGERRGAYGDGTGNDND